MATTTTFYRKANVPSSEAITSLLKRFPTAEVVSFTQVTANAEQADYAKAKEGELVYEATIRVAEFPPTGGDDTSDAPEESESGSKPDTPAEESSETDDAPESDDSPVEDKSEGKGGDGDGEGDGAKPKKLSPDEQMIHLLQQILHAVQGAGGPLGGPDGPDGPDGPAGPAGPGDLDLPDVGAPDQGEALPPPAAGPGVKAPLPPPVREKSPVGAGAFAHVANTPEVNMVRRDASEASNRQIIEEAREVLPTHVVAKIQRTGAAVINGQTVNVAENKIAVVTLVRK